MIRVVRWVAVAWVALVLAAFGAGAAAWVAGWDLVAVDTASMAPTVPRGALAVVEPVAAGNVEVGDVIAFRDPLDRSSTVLHRVERIASTDDGGLSFQTQGDGNRTPDPAMVSEMDLRGHLRMHVPRLGVGVAAMRPPWGTVFVATVPLVLLAALELGRRRDRHRAAEAGSTDAESVAPDEPEDASVLTSTSP